MALWDWSTASAGCADRSVPGHREFENEVLAPCGKCLLFFSSPLALLFGGSNTPWAVDISPESQLISSSLSNIFSPLLIEPAISLPFRHQVFQVDIGCEVLSAASCMEVPCSLLGASCGIIRGIVSPGCFWSTTDKCWGRRIRAVRFRMNRNKQKLGGSHCQSHI